MESFSAIDRPLRRIPSINEDRRLPEVKVRYRWTYVQCEVKFSIHMTQPNTVLRPGDLVEVRTPQEISATLDANGTVDQVPFMREMVQFCGKRFRVSQKVVIVCSSGTKTGSVLRTFRNGDIVLLEGLRCSGEDHDGCQKACTIFWRETWLRKVEGPEAQATIDTAAATQLWEQLNTKASDTIYFCQASEILRATRSMGKVERYLKFLTDMRVGNCGPIEMARRIGIFLFWKLRRMLFGPYARGKRSATPAEALNLKGGELVQVKPMGKIRETLDGTASNRGLWFSPNMRLLCGQKRRVEKRIEKLIVDGTGEMRSLKNTVFLEDSHCSCAHIAFGGCSRQEYVYWREVWLRRAETKS